MIHFCLLNISTVLPMNGGTAIEMSMPTHKKLRLAQTPSIMECMNPY